MEFVSTIFSERVAFSLKLNSLYFEKNNNIPKNPTSTLLLKHSRLE